LRFSIKYFAQWEQRRKILLILPTHPDPETVNAKIVYLY
jgi:hypothetical protein